jgi:hypothetical protein
MCLEGTLPECFLDVRVCCVCADADDLISILLLVFLVGHVCCGRQLVVPCVELTGGGGGVNGSIRQARAFELRIAAFARRARQRRPSTHPIMKLVR